MPGSVGMLKGALQTNVQVSDMLSSGPPSCSPFPCVLKFVWLTHIMPHDSSCQVVHCMRLIRSVTSFTVKELNKNNDLWG